MGLANQLVSAESIQITMVSLKIHLAFAVLACGLWMTTAASVHTIIAPEEVKEVYLLSADDPAESSTDPNESTTDPNESTTDPNKSTTDPNKSTTDQTETTTDQTETTTDPNEPTTTPAPGAASSLTSTCQVLFLTVVISILL